MQLAAVYEEIQEIGGELLAIAPQPVEINLNLKEKRALPFPILADDDQAVIQEWGVFDHQDPKKRLIPYPATYIVGQDGRIAWAYLGAATRDRPMVGEVMAALKKVAFEVKAE